MAFAQYLNIVCVHANGTHPRARSYFDRPNLAVASLTLCSDCNASLDILHSLIRLPFKLDAQQIFALLQYIRYLIASPHLSLFLAL